MTRKRMPALDLAGARLLEPLGRALMGLQLWHLCLTRAQQTSAMRLLVLELPPVWQQT